MRLENSTTEVALGGKTEERWRQDPLLNQSHRTQLLIGNRGKMKGKDGTTYPNQEVEGMNQSRKEIQGLGLEQARTFRIISTEVVKVTR